ncbi:hypothetical protein QP150_00180 [Sphingomonas sp. 22L2VL55-3]
MRTTLLITMAISLSGCTIERIGPPGVVLTRPIRVPAKDVQVFKTLAEVKGRFTVIDSIFVKDDGKTTPELLERDLRVIAGARGANAIITDPLNRTPNGLRVDLRPTLDDPFKYYSATAIWIGDGERPEKYLGTLGGGGR